MSSLVLSEKESSPTLGVETFFISHVKTIRKTFGHLLSLHEVCFRKKFARFISLVISSCYFACYFVFSHFTLALIELTVTGKIKSIHLPGRSVEKNAVVFFSEHGRSVEKTR